MLDADTKFSTYLRAFFTEWLSGMSGSASVPFAALALWVSGRNQKILLSVLAILCAIFGSYRVWRNERASSLAQLHQKEAGILVLENKIAEVSRKPYPEDLEQTANRMLDNMTSQGLLLLRHLLMCEPLDVGRAFIAEISLQTQFEQMTIAEQAGVVRRDVKWRGAGADTTYFVNQQFRPVLENILYERLSLISGPSSLTGLPRN